MPFARQNPASTVAFSLFGKKPQPPKPAAGKAAAKATEASATAKVMAKAKGGATGATMTGAIGYRACCASMPSSRT